MGFLDKARDMLAKHGEGDTTAGATGSGPDSSTSAAAAAGASGDDSGLQPGSHPGDVAGQPTASQRVQPDQPALDAPVTGGGAPPPEERPQGPGAGEGGSPSTGSPTSESGEETLGGVQTADSGETDQRE